MMDAFNLKALFPSSGEEYFIWYNIIGDSIILSVFTILFCMAGLLGNGNIIWLLGFRVQRKPFVIYALNLAVADFGTLAFLLVMTTAHNIPMVFGLDLPLVVFVLLISFFFLMFSSCQLLLTAMSIDRWVFVLFPNWYQGHRSPLLFTTVCAFIWALSFVLCGLPIIQMFTLWFPGYSENTIALEYIMSTSICLFLVILSTLTLFIKVGLKSPRGPGGNLSNAILLMFLSYLLFTILTIVCFSVDCSIPFAYFVLWTSLKSSINSLIYFLAGRQNGGKFQKRMKVLLQGVFKEERDTGMELQPHTQTVF
ncbi:mas-related G-protein coupled receptor member D-like [Paroedura picta]|uniref:mas-related G-protein coupled receptor member D-like n=1 Tax=Paroedura picta TaxID=143630 RepID=UPI0040577B0F